MRINLAEALLVLTIFEIRKWKGRNQVEFSEKN
jgi:hypothetical protein